MQSASEEALGETKKLQELALVLLSMNKSK